MPKRLKTKYPGVFYRNAKRIGGKGSEKVYYIVFKKDGKVIEEKAGRQFADNMTPAKASSFRSERIEGKRLSRKEKREQEEARKRAKAGKWTIDRLWQAYKESRPDNKGRATDEGRYKKYIKPVFRNKEPSAILSLDVDRLRIKLLKKLSPQTVKHVLNLLTWIINFGVKRNLCQGISFHIKKPQVNNQKTEDLTQDQLARLLKAIDEDPNIQVANLMKLALFTGMRRGELFNLKWEDIDYERGFITIRDPKGGQDQKIPLNDSARAILSSHPKSGIKFAFPGQDGNRRVTASVGVNRIKRRAGLPKDFRPLHGLRHTYASMLASSGQVDMYTLQKLLTHKSPVMTQRYAHLRDETLKRAASLAGDLFEQVANPNKAIIKKLDKQQK
jgi:integrase